MAKANQERMTLDALSRPSTASSTCLVAVPRPSQSVAIGAFADGSTLGSTDFPYFERATSHRHASASPGCAFSWVLDYARRLNHDPSSSPYVDFFTTILVPRPSLMHVIGKGGGTLAKIEDLAQCLLCPFAVLLNIDY